MSKIKIQIKSLAGSILFEYEKENNTLKDTLREAIKEGADLTRANLTRADLSRADLYRANLTGADLYGANLTGADLSRANLSRANLTGADLYGANLTGADLTGADLTGADLYGADLYGAKEIPYIPLNCPSEGAFIGWKKVRNCLVKLEIPEDAQRLSSVSMKCRCDKAKVLSVWDISLEKEVTEIINDAYNHQTIYKVGEMVYPDSFDENRWKECSNGIHFFINKQDAINY